MEFYVVVGLDWWDAARAVRSWGVLVKKGRVRMVRVEGKRVWLPVNVRVRRVDGRRVWLPGRLRFDGRRVWLPGRVLGSEFVLIAWVFIYE
jgi:hypothetical protein